MSAVCSQPYVYTVLVLVRPAGLDVGEGSKGELDISAHHVGTQAGVLGDVVGRGGRGAVILGRAQLQDAVVVFGLSGERVGGGDRRCHRCGCLISIRGRVACAHLGQ